MLTAYTARGFPLARLIPDQVSFGSLRIGQRFWSSYDEGPLIKTNDVTAVMVGSSPYHHPVFFDREDRVLLAG